jgi:hypothetical protein
MGVGKPPARKFLRFAIESLRDTERMWVSRNGLSIKPLSQPAEAAREMPFHNRSDLTTVNIRACR